MPPLSASHITVVVSELDAETGLWCPHCLLPSGVARTCGLAVGRWPLGVLRVARCEDCGAPL
jgi:hypothetical protein